MTYDKKVEQLIQEALDRGMTLEEIASKLGLEIEG